jgi:two-component system, OmpR family, sensor kinase
VLSRLSLRARLVLGVIVLCAAGLAVAGVATYASLRSFLLDRTDKSLEDTSHGIDRVLHEGCDGRGARLPGATPGDYFEVRNSAGTVVCALQVPDFSGTTPSPPALPEKLDAPPALGPVDGAYFTVDAREGGGRYRVLVQADPGSDAILVAATSLEDVDATLRRLLLIMLLVTAAVLVAMTTLGLWVVRIGLRPLDAIEETAAAISAGDLSRRVERAEPNTEVGRLGLSLNAMLGQIESAFTAQAASERKLRRFVADASHELRTPLAAVRAYAELFTRGADRRPDDLARSMTGISRESERMSLLVDDLLLLARLDEGRPLAREPVQLDRVVGEAVDTARTVEPDRPIELDAEPVEVLGDGERLRQIVDNLLANARSHTPRRAPVAVRVGTQDGQAVVTVRDSGPGLDPDDLERIFERFYRADQSRSRASGGVGLGLSIVAAVAEAHGGSVSASSDGSSGATFTIALPQLDRGAEPPREPGDAELTAAS